PEQDLDHANVYLLLQQVSRKTVPKRVHRNALVDLCRLRRGVHSAVELTGAERVDGIEAWKQPAADKHLALATGNPPPGTQAGEQNRRKHGIAILAALALF